MFKTVAHEVFHAYQWQEIEEARAARPHDRRAETWATNWSDPSSSGNPVETDAEAFASGAPFVRTPCDGCDLEA